ESDREILTVVGEVVHPLQVADCRGYLESRTPSADWSCRCGQRVVSDKCHLRSEEIECRFLAQSLQRLSGASIRVAVLHKSDAGSVDVVELDSGFKTCKPV